MNLLRKGKLSDRELGELVSDIAATEAPSPEDDAGGFKT
jgi:hypothetical protein